MFNKIKYLISKNIKKENSEITNTNFSESTFPKTPDLNKFIFDGLTPGEIILLDWINKTSRIHKFPKYFELSYYLNIDKSLEKLFDLKYIYKVSRTKEELASTLTVNELKNILKQNSEGISGNKIELINRAIKYIDNETLKNIPSTIKLTKEGNNIIQKYKYIIDAHANTHKNFNHVQKIIEMKLSMPQWTTKYSDIYWALLIKEEITHSGDMNFGSLRNNYFSRYNLLLNESKYDQSMLNLIITLLFDFSGLNHGTDPVIDFIENNKTLQIKFNELHSKINVENFDNIFNKALEIFSKQRETGFINEHTILVIKKNIVEHNGFENIVKYIKTIYKNNTLDN